MGPIGCPEASVKNYRSTLRKIPEERRSALRRGGSLKSRKKGKFDVRHRVMLIMIIIRTSPRQQHFININVNSLCYFTATYFDRISVFMFTFS